MASQTPETVEHLSALLEDAGRTLVLSRVPGCWPSRGEGWWPEVVHLYEEAYGWEAEELVALRVTAAHITRMEATYRWVQLIPLDPAGPDECGPWSVHGGAMLRKIIWIRSLWNPVQERPLYSWKRMGEKLCASPQSIRTWHAQALGVILAGLAAQASGRPLRTRVRGPACITRAERLDAVA